MSPTRRLLRVPDVARMERARDIQGLIRALGYKPNWMVLLLFSGRVISDVQFGARDALVRIGAIATEPLIGALGSPLKDARIGAARVLGEIGASQAVEPLIHGLDDDDHAVRRSVVEALGTLKSPKAVEPLISRLQDGNSLVRMEAAIALGRIGDGRAIEPLCAALGDSRADVRKGAAEALGQIGDERCAQPLLAALRNAEKDDFTAHAAGLALARIGGSAADGLTAALSNASSRARMLVAEVLGTAGDWRSVGPLIATLGDPERLVRQTAARSLVTLYTSGRLADQYRAQILSLRPGITTQHADVAGYHQDTQYHKPYLQGRGYRLVEAASTHADRTVPHSDNGGIGVPFEV